MTTRDGIASPAGQRSHVAETPGDTLMVMTDEFDQLEAEAREHAYLIARGVRPLAIVGHCPAVPATMFEMARDLELLSLPGAIPFVAPRDDGIADYGYAASKWVIDLLCWAESDAVPAEHRHRIVGLLLGYSVEAIRSFEEQGCGRLFDEPTRSDTAST